MNMAFKGPGVALDCLREFFGLKSHFASRKAPFVVWVGIRYRFTICCAAVKYRLIALKKIFLSHINFRVQVTVLVRDSNWSLSCALHRYALGHRAQFSAKLRLSQTTTVRDGVKPNSVLLAVGEPLLFSVATLFPGDGSLKFASRVVLLEPPDLPLKLVDRLVALFKLLP